MNNEYPGDRRKLAKPTKQALPITPEMLILMYQYVEGPPKIQEVTKRSKIWRNGAKSNETETKSDETKQKETKLNKK